MTVIAEKYINQLKRLSHNDKLEVIEWITVHHNELLTEKNAPNWQNDSFEDIGAKAFFDDWSEEEDHIWSDFLKQTAK